MLVESPRLGRVEVDEKQIVTFPEGLLGFREFKRYFFRESSAGGALLWMQSVEMPALAFIVTDPRIIKPDYQVKATPAQLEPLRITDPSQAEVWVILTIPEDTRKTTANLQGPIIVNRQAGLAAQVVLNEENVTTKYPVLEGLRAHGRA